MSTEATRQTLLDATEQLLAEQGYAATTLRQLTTRASANLAAVSYHFGGKEQITRAALQRRIEPINRERLRRLRDLAEQRAPGDPPPTAAAVLAAFLQPLLHATATMDIPPAALRMFCRLLGEEPPFLREFLAEQFGEVLQHFGKALQQALPHLDQATIAWRLHFAIGAIAHLLPNATTIRDVTKGLCDPMDADTLEAQLLTFLGAAFAAPKPRDAAAGSRP